jgi:hypothetical protein
VNSVFFLSTRQKQRDISDSVKRATTLAQRTVPVVVSAATVIRSSCAIIPRPGGSTFPEGDGFGQIDISAAAMGHVHPQSETAL